MAATKRQRHRRNLTILIGLLVVCVIALIITLTGGAGPGNPLSDSPFVPGAGIVLFSALLVWELRRPGELD